MTKDDTPFFQTGETKYGKPIDLVCCERDTLRLGIRHGFELDDDYFRGLGKVLRDGVPSRGALS